MMLSSRTIVILVLLGISLHLCRSEERSKTNISKKLKKGLELLGNSNTYIGTVIDIGSTIYSVFKSHPDTEIDLQSISQDLKNLINSNKNIAALTEEINEKVDKVIELQEILPLLQSVSEQITLLEEQYKNYLRYKKYGLDRKRKVAEIEGFANSAISRQSIIRRLVTIKAKLVEDAHGINKDKTLLHAMLKHMQKFGSICGKKKSMNMMINDLYKIVLDTEIKGHILMLFAYDVKKAYSGGDYTRDLQIMKEGFVQRGTEIMTAFKKALKQSSRAVWTCDPGKDFDEDFISFDYGRKGKRNTFLNMEPVFANNGMVVTGARFRKGEMKDSAGRAAWEIYIEIQQGKLLANGSIDKSTLSWKNNRLTSNPHREQFVYLSAKLWMTAQDFDGMLDGNKPILVTGLSFGRKYWDDFNLQVYGSPVDYTSKVPSVLPKRIAAKSFISLKRTANNVYGNGDESVNNYVNRVSPADPDAIIMSKKKGSETSSKPSNTISRYNYFIRPELASNALLGRWYIPIPYLDSQDVITSPATPLTGAALYHKGLEGFGGYVGIELRTVDLSRKINVDRVNV